jgi:predicted  nucleic acid-binding Zn-ribbon protein
MKFKTSEEFQTFESIIQVIKHEEYPVYNRVLHRMRSIDAEFEVKQKENQTLQPDIESINLAWNKLELTVNRIENDLKKYEKLRNDLDLIEHDITNIEIKVC